MSEAHLSSRQIEEFLRGALCSEENGRAVRHLLTGCPTCRTAAAQHWPPPRPRTADLEEGFSRALDGLLPVAKSIAAERAAAPVLLRELQAHPAGRQLVLAQNSRRFWTWSLTEIVLERAFEAGFDDAQEAGELAELGVALAAALRNTACPAPVVADLRARAHSTRGNTRRIQGDLVGAESELREASRLLAEGTGDPQEEARVLLRVAYLLGDQRRFEEAVRSFDRAIALFRLVGDDHWVGRTLIDKGRFRGHAGRLERAIQLIESGLELLDPARDPRMALAAKHNLAVFRCESGDLGRATALVRELLPQYAIRHERLSMLRLRWLEGKLAQAQRRLPRAEEAFLEVQEGYLRRELGYDAALVTLDLAGVYLEQGRAADLKGLMTQVLPVFQTFEVHREALVALALFKRAADLQEATVRWVVELSAYLERARGNPKLRFQPPGPTPVAG